MLQGIHCITTIYIILKGNHNNGEELVFVDITISYIILKVNHNFIIIKKLSIGTTTYIILKGNIKKINYICNMNNNKKIPVYHMGYEKDSKDYILIYIDNMEYPNIFKSRVYNNVHTGISLCIY